MGQGGRDEADLGGRRQVSVHVVDLLLETCTQTTQDVMGQSNWIT